MLGSRTERLPAPNQGPVWAESRRTEGQKKRERGKRGGKGFGSFELCCCTHARHARQLPDQGAAAAAAASFQQSWLTASKGAVKLPCQSSDLPLPSYHHRDTLSHHGKRSQVSLEYLRQRKLALQLTLSRAHTFPPNQGPTEARAKRQGSWRNCKVAAQGQRGGQERHVRYLPSDFPPDCSRACVSVDRSPSVCVILASPPVPFLSLPHRLKQHAEDKHNKVSNCKGDAPACPLQSQLSCSPELETH